MTRSFDWSPSPSELDLDELETRARKATRGPWRAGVTESEHAVWTYDDGALGRERLLLRMNEHFENTDDRVYLASVPPEIVLELVARARRGQARERVVVRTARISSTRADRLDITRKSGRDGLFLAPTWETLNPVLEARKKSPKNGPPSAEFLAAWERYTDVFLGEMRLSFAKHREQWNELLSRPSVTLCCYCTDPWKCHRTLLATRVLPALGARYAGETT